MDTALAVFISDDKNYHHRAARSRVREGKKSAKSDNADPQLFGSMFKYP